ncbi:DUF4921 family protein [Propionibacterium freudenreichii]|jgi:galactose-1-phosphate uridylyltransferase|uniref:DUF4921 family protein n=1 Tax=Propionibacterium freudenreichii TaxID=1744 RepID=UPI00054380C0|nr:DUF4921 family protein [Propionibacterium freudenreichii]CEG94219.1 Galactose-1-phosphate uridylyltransferase (UDP-glucose---hexose-1-phosphate uridylyltransferase) [Propionibacterium freudenreichii]
MPTLGLTEAIRTMPDGTVKQVNPLSGVEVWTVPGRGNRPLATPVNDPRALSADDFGHSCAFCADRMAETPPEKARRVHGADGWQTLTGVLPEHLHDTVAEFRRIPNLFEIVGYPYWVANYDYKPSPAAMARYRAYRNDAGGREHLLAISRTKLAASGLAPAQVRATPDDELLDDAIGFFAGGHDVIVARRHFVDGATDSSQLAGSGALSPDEHAEYMRFTVDTLADLYRQNRYARYVAVFQNWLRPAGASFDHLHKQLVAIDQHGTQAAGEVERLRSNPNIYNDLLLGTAVQHNLVIAENDSAIVFAGFGHRYPTLEIYSKSATCEPWNQSDKELDDMSALVHACHAATGMDVPSNEEWHHRAPDMDVPMPWRINLKWRVSTLAGFEGGTKIYLNTIDPWHLRDRVVPRLHALRRQGRLADNILLDSECPAQYNSLMYNPLLQRRDTNRDRPIRIR